MTASPATPSFVAVASETVTPASLDAINRRNAYRMLPILMMGYVLNTLDKGNIGFASLEMNRELNFTPAIFGLGAGVFFITYTLFEIPSNMLLRRYGARLWLSRILVTWGFASMAMALTWGKESFYVLRMILGLAEAGWYPGVIYFLTLWFPKDVRARAITWFVLGVPVSTILGAPLSGALLGLPEIGGIRSWQWLFIVEGLPTVILGLIAWHVLRDTPADAEWLSPQERARLAVALETAPASDAPQPRSAASYRVLALFCAINFVNALGLYSTALWLPRAIKQLGNLTNFQTGLVNAIPFIFSAIVLILAGRSSDRLNDRKWHVVALFLIGSAGMAATTLTAEPGFRLVWLVIAIMGGFGVQSTLYAMFSEGLARGGFAGRGLAGSLATITTLGNLGGFCGPYAVGVLLERTGDFRASLLGIAAAFLAAGLLAILVRHRADSVRAVALA